MGLARDIVELEGQLRETGAVDLFAPISRGGLLDDPRTAVLLSRVPSNAASVLRLALQALRVQHDELRSHLVDAELVATLPPETPGVARPTYAAVREMVEGATSEVILLGYELTDPNMVALLSDARGRRAEVVVICDRDRGGAGRLRDAWPDGVPRPRVFHDRERPDAAPYAKMHAKCLLVDSTDLLVTSANFTFHGLHGNIEIGVRLRGRPAAEARKIFSHLVESGIVQEVNEP